MLALSQSCVHTLVVNVGGWVKQRVPATQLSMYCATLVQLAPSADCWLTGGASTQTPIGVSVRVKRVCGTHFSDTPSTVGQPPPVSAVKSQSSEQVPKAVA